MATFEGVLQKESVLAIMEINSKKKKQIEVCITSSVQLHILLSPTFYTTNCSRSLLKILTLSCLGKNCQSLTSCSTLQLDHLCPMAMEDILMILFHSSGDNSWGISDVFYIMLPRVIDKYPMAVGNSVTPLYLTSLSSFFLGSHAWINGMNKSLWLIFSLMVYNYKKI